MKDWTGNSKATFTTLGASNHSDYKRAEHDFYATNSRAIDEEFCSLLCMVRLGEGLHWRTRDSMD